jgi:recombination protein U
VNIAPIGSREVERMGYANRGQSFENHLNYANTLYARRNIALINKRPTPIKVLKSKGVNILKAVWEAKSTVDYDGVYRGKAIYFEAKSAQGKSFALKNIHAHQLEYLQKAEEQGAICFLLIELRDYDQVFFVPYSIIKHYVYHAAHGGRKSIPKEDFDVYAYEVVSSDRSRIDYLHWVDKLIEEGAA